MIVMYSTNCPKCFVLGKKLDKAGIEYDVITDIDEIAAKGILSVPTLEIDGELLDFKSAVDWVNRKENSK